MSHFYDKDGTSMTLMEWAKQMEDTKYGCIGRTTLPDGRLVLTDWLGLDLQLSAGPPLIFETMVFNGDDEIQERYSTMAHAEAGHKRLVKELLGT